VNPVILSEARIEVFQTEIGTEPWNDIDEQLTPLLFYKPLQEGMDFLPLFADQQAAKLVQFFLEGRALGGFQVGKDFLPAPVPADDLLLLLARQILFIGQIPYPLVETVAPTGLLPQRELGAGVDVFEERNAQVHGPVLVHHLVGEVRRIGLDDLLPIPEKVLVVNARPDDAHEGDQVRVVRLDVVNNTLEVDGAIVDARHVHV